MAKSNEPVPYWKQRQQMKMQGKKPESLKRHEAKAKSSFFEIMIAKAPAKCQNCSKNLQGTKTINPAAIVAHILPKREKHGFPSVATDPRNIVYLCGDCHTNMDNKGEDYVKKMPIFKIMVDRVALMVPDMPEAEQNRIPLYFLK